MGRPSRLISALLAVTALAVTALTGTACGSETRRAEQQRELLTPPDPVAQQKARQEKARVVDDDGIPVPGELEVAGLQIPRTFEITRQLEHQWYLRSNRISADALARYVEARVFTGSLTRTSVGGVVFESAQLRHDESLPRIWVRVTPTKNKKNASELHIRQAPPQVFNRPSGAEIEAQLEARRRYAH